MRPMVIIVSSRLFRIMVLSASILGYLPDQFLQDVTNQRTDAYGGTIENRTRFVKEILGSIIDALGESRVAVRFSPWSTFQGTVISMGLSASFPQAHFGCSHANVGPPSHIHSYRQISQH